MRRFLGIAAVAAALSMLACETSNAQRREGRTPSRYNDTTTRPVENRPPPGEYRPNDMGPMRGDESFPAEYPGSSRSGLGDAVGGSADTPTGSTIDRNASTPPSSGTSIGTGGAYSSPSGETGTAPTNSDRLTPGTTGTGSSRSVDSEDRYQDPAKDTSKNTESSTKSSTGTGTSTGMSSSEPSDSTGQVGSGSKSSASKKAQGRTGSSSTTRPRTGVGAPPASDPLGNTNSDAPDVSGTPPIPSDVPTSSNPYDLGAAKNPKMGADAGTGATDGGTRFEGNLPSDLQNTY